MNYTDWNEADLSAYLDGQLDPERQAALEAALERNLALRERLETLRQTVALMQAIPLREVPRNYLLTPSMVAEPKVDKPRRVGPSLMMMRLATALSAAAFAIAVGLQVSPIRLFVAQSTASYDRISATEVQELLVEEEAEEAVTMMEVPVEPPAEKAMPREMTPMPEGTPLPQPELAAGAAPSWDEVPGVGGEAPTWDEGGAEELGSGEGWGIGGGAPAEGPDSRNAGAPLALPLTTATPEIGICNLEDGDMECIPVEPLPDAAELVTGAQETSGVEEPTAEGEVMALSSSEEGVQEEQVLPAPEGIEVVMLESEARPQVGLQGWTILLGIVTFGLGIATWWLSRRH